MKKPLLLLVVFLFSPFQLHAESVANTVSAATHTAEHFPLQKNTLELKASGGSYLGATLGQTWVIETGAVYHFNPTLGLGVHYAFSQANPDSSSTFGSNLSSDSVHLLTAGAQISNDAMFRIGKHWLPMDFFMTLGAGGMQIDQTWKPTGLVGGGVKFFTKKPWLAINVEVNNYLHHTPQPGKDHLDFDVAFVGGISVFLPPLHR